MSFKVKDVGRFSAIFKTYIFRDKNNQKLQSKWLRTEINQETQKLAWNDQKQPKMAKNG